MALAYFVGLARFLNVGPLCGLFITGPEPPGAPCHAAARRANARARSRAGVRWYFCREAWKAFLLGFRFRFFFGRTGFIIIYLK